MPANRTERPRAEKAAELQSIAGRLFLERGYAGTTMASIAAEAGVASNVVHWYFASKDALFAAAMEELLTSTLSSLLERALEPAPTEEARRRLERLLGELVGRLVRADGLIATVHERAHRSEIVAAFHERAHALYAETLDRALEPLDLPKPDRELAAAALLMAIEGLVMHRTARPEAERMLSFLVTRLTERP